MSEVVQDLYNEVRIYWMETHSPRRLHRYFRYDHVVAVLRVIIHMNYFSSLD